MSQAVSTGQQAAAALPGQYLTFMLDGEPYALGSWPSRRSSSTGRHAGADDAAVHPRGDQPARAVVPVIDLGVRFGAGPTAITRRTCIVIVEVENEDGAQDVGILVDAVNEVMEIAAADIEPAPAFGARIRTDFIAGMGKLDDKFVVILDPVRLLSVDDMAALAQSGVAGAGHHAANDTAEREIIEAIAA